MDILRAYVLQVDAVDMRRYLHIVLHARYSFDVVDAVGNFEQAAAVMDAEVLHRLRDGQADRRAAARLVGHDQVGGKRIEPTVDTLDAGVKRLKVDADIGATLVPHASSHQTHVLIEYMFDNTRLRGHRQNLSLFGRYGRAAASGFNAALKSAKQLGKPRFVA